MSRSRSWMIGLAVLCWIAAGAAGCKARNRSGDLHPPDDAPAWESRYSTTFDDDFTREPIELQGRAPHDVRDQLLFNARLGYAAIVALVRVEQVWGRGRYQGRKDQYLDIEIEEVLHGELPKGTRNSQLLRITGEDDLPGELQGDAMLLFVRWAPGEQPPFHHHLMPAGKQIVAYIRAVVQHAASEGMLGGPRKRKRRAAQDAAADEPAVP